MASTYVNDLRLNEMATGDASGTWGTVTNTNLELIGEALGYGTEAITTNADTHTSTIADGATDPVRAMYVKYTGTLDSACTITIAPNTINRMQFIENGTSGSQNIIISQGSGANITIPAGDVKAVYLDGAGSGAAVVDAFASLSTVDLKVQDDLTVTDDASVGGDLLVSGEVQTANIGFTDGDNAITISDGGGTSFAQKITADAGIDIDNFNIDGTTLALSSGDFTLDVAGDIVFDAGGSDITFSDDGTEFGRIKQVSGGMRIQSTASDADMTFMGNDNTTEFTALTLDMSAAGHATFNEGIKLSGLNGGTGLAFDLAGSSDFIMKESSTNDVFQMGNLFHNISSNGFGIGLVPTHNFNLSAAGAVEARFASTDGDCSLQISSDTDEGQSSELNFMSGTSGRGSIVYDHNTTAASQKMIFKTGDLGISALTILGNGELQLTDGNYLASSGITSIAWTNSYFEVADNSIFTLTDIANTGALVSIGQNRSNQGVTYDHALFFMETGTAPTFVANPSGRFGASSGTDTLTNIYASGASMVIENKVGTTVRYSVAINRFLGN
jgi:hypothetical protein